MDVVETKPGPDAHQAFRLGMLASAVVALGGIGFLYQFDIVSIPLVAFALVILFPIYLVLVASALSVWLGFDKGKTDLRPVHRERKRRN